MVDDPDIQQALDMALLKAGNDAELNRQICDLVTNGTCNAPPPKDPGPPLPPDVEAKAMPKKPNAPMQQSTEPQTASADLQKLREQEALIIPASEKATAHNVLLKLRQQQPVASKVNEHHIEVGDTVAIYPLAPAMQFLKAFEGTIMQVAGYEAQVRPNMASWPRWKPWPWFFKVELLPFPKSHEAGSSSGRPKQPALWYRPEGPNSKSSPVPWPVLQAKPKVYAKSSHTQLRGFRHGELVDLEVEHDDTKTEP